MITNLLSQLNQLQETRSVLDAALRIVSEEMNLSGGWAWLIASSGGAFYLAATHELPQELSARQDLLGGECWCLQRYLEGELTEPGNVSEMKCSRIDKLPEHPGQLRYHATVPLRHAGTGFGLLNFLHADSRTLTDADLTLLAEAGQHISAALSRSVNYDRALDDGRREGRQRLLARLQRFSGSSGGADRSTLRPLLDELRVVTEDVAPAKINYPHEPLTKREREVLRSVAAGNTNRSVGEALFISERTVKFHVSSILLKLDAGNRTQAVEIARQRRLLD